MTKHLELLPAVDIAGGQAVQLVQGVAGSEKRFGDPVEAALRWQTAGAEWLHLVDLDAAFGRGHNRELQARIVGALDIQVEMSGGIRDDESLEAALATGCRRVNIGTAAHLDLDVERPDDPRLELPVVPVAEGGVEVDEVDPLRPGLLPAQRRLDRVAEPLLRPVDALHQLDGLAALDVHGGQELEVRLRGGAGHASILGAAVGALARAVVRRDGPVVRRRAGIGRCGRSG